MNKPSILILSALLGAMGTTALAQQKPEATTEVMAASAPGKGTIARMATVTATARDR